MDNGWRDDFALGDPVVDAEHKYFFQLAAQLERQCAEGTHCGDPTVWLEHLIGYAHKHFSTEEQLMTAIGYAELSAHREEHRLLSTKLMNLMESYLEDGCDIAEDLAGLVHAWLVTHIMEVDMKIRAVLPACRPAGAPSLPAFADREQDVFKQCTLCERRWSTFEDLCADSGVQVVGCQLDATNPLFNLVYFNCRCGTTLAMFLREFIEGTAVPFALDQHGGAAQRPAYCLRANEDGPCLPRCACTYTRRILDMLGGAGDSGSKGGTP